MRHEGKPRRTRRWVAGCLSLSLALGACSGDDESRPSAAERALDVKSRALDEREEALDRRAAWLEKRARAITERASALRESEAETRARMAIKRSASEWARMKQAAQRFVGVVRLGALRLESDQHFTVARGISFARELRAASMAALIPLSRVRFPDRYRRRALNLRAEFARLLRHARGALAKCGVEPPRPRGKRPGGDRQRQGGSTPPPASVRGPCRLATIPMVGLVTRVRDQLEQVTPLT